MYNCKLRLLLPFAYFFFEFFDEDFLAVGR